MKYIVSFLLLALMAAPSMAQRPQRGDFKKHDQRVEKHVGEKSCPKCVALKKQIAGLRKRLEEATKGRGKATKGRGRADHRRGSRSEGRRGSRGKHTPTKKKIQVKGPYWDQIRKRMESFRKGRGSLQLNEGRWQRGWTAKK